jgi:TFIIF-interacting CTD phosphatase-like protein
MLLTGKIPLSSSPAPPSEDSDVTVKLLPDRHPDDQGKKCLVLDLDETLIANRNTYLYEIEGADIVFTINVSTS